LVALAFVEGVAKAAVVVFLAAGAAKAALVSFLGSAWTYSP